MKMLPATSVFALIFFLFGCGHPPVTATQSRGDTLATPAENPAVKGRVERLAQDLVTLLGHPDEETILLAETAVRGADALARQYQAVYSGKFNNFLILVGLRNRGLCCHWTRDLIDILRSLKLRNFHLSWAVSEYATNQEHSSIVVTTAERAFASGIVLDAWRNSGELYWSTVSADLYEWQPHPEDDGAGLIICEADQKN